MDMTLFNSCEKVTDTPGCMAWKAYYKACPIDNVLGIV